jgi:hypothetical protein
MAVFSSSDCIFNQLFILCKQFHKKMMGMKNSKAPERGFEIKALQKSIKEKVAEIDELKVLFFFVPFCVPLECALIFVCF